MYPKTKEKDKKRFENQRKEKYIKQHSHFNKSFLYPPRVPSAKFAAARLIMPATLAMVRLARAQSPESTVSRIEGK